MFFDIEKTDKENIIKIIEQDPKPAYKDENKEYNFLFSDYEICVEINEKTAKILKINKI